MRSSSFKICPLNRHPMDIADVKDDLWNYFQVGMVGMLPQKCQMIKWMFLDRDPDSFRSLKMKRILRGDCYWEGEHLKHPIVSYSDTKGINQIASFRHEISRRVDCFKSWNMFWLSPQHYRQKIPCKATKSFLVSSSSWSRSKRHI